MAEVIGLVASIAQLMGTGLTAYEYAHQFKNAPKEQAAIIDGVWSLVNLLTHLRRKVENAQDGTRNEPWLEATTMLTPHLDKLQHALEEIAVKLISRKDEPWNKVGKRIVWPWNEKKCLEILSRIRRLGELIRFALQESNMLLVQAIKNDTEVIPAINSGMKEVLTAVNDLAISKKIQERNEILAWLSSLDFISRQEAVENLRMAGTCEWLLHRPEFESWVKTEGSTLWCPGIPGAGKIMMASAIIEHLQQRFPGHDTANIVYVYFDYGQQTRHRLHDILSDIYKQLLLNTKTIPIGLNELYTRLKDKKKRPEITYVIELLKDEIKQRPTFIVIDALDECCEEDRSPLMKILQSLKPDVHLLVTSRPFDSIATHFKNQPCLKIAADHYDLRKYISYRLQHESDFSMEVSKDIAFTDEIIKTVIAKAQNMFLLARLHVDSLMASGTKKRMRKQLSKLPEELATTYDQTMARINSQKAYFFDLAYHTLSWITNAYRPLKLVELRHAFATELGNANFDNEGLPSADDLTSCCAGLVVYEAADSTIRFVHYTTQEYFCNERGVSWFPDAQLDISRKCLTYLLFDELFQRRRSRDELLYDYPLINYAACHWGRHAQGELECDQEVQSMALRLLKTEARPSDEFMINRQPEDREIRPNRPPQLRGGSFGLHIAASFGLTAIVSLLLETGLRVDQAHDGGQTALHWACKNGHYDTARFLLEQQADVNGRVAWNPSTPLTIATAGGHLPIVKLLINNGASINDYCSLFYHGGHPGIPALHEAALHGHTEIARYLLDRGAQMTTGQKSAMRKAIERGHFDIVQLFFGRGAKLQGTDGWLALKQAIEGRNIRILQLLIDAGLDIQYTPPNKVSIPQFAINSGFIACIELIRGQIPPSTETAGAGVSAIQLLTSQHWFTSVEEVPATSLTSSPVDSSATFAIHKRYRRRGSSSLKEGSPSIYFGLIIPENILSIRRLIFHITSDNKARSELLQHYGIDHHLWIWCTCFVQYCSEPGVPFVEHMLRESIHVSGEYRTHSITWDRDSPYPKISECVKRLHGGDIIQIRTKAHSRRQTSYLHNVEVEIIS